MRKIPGGFCGKCKRVETSGWAAQNVPSAKRAFLWPNMRHKDGKQFTQPKHDFVPVPVALLASAVIADGQQTNSEPTVTM
jgi:hypothetical protein